MKITEQITSLQTALDYNRETLEQFEYRTQFDTPGQKAGKALEVIAISLNEGKPLSKIERWYYPLFERVSNGVRISFYGYDSDRAYADVGSRLCVNSRQKAIHFGKNFIELWSTYLYEQ
jgi:hypothetical protein